MRYRNEKFIKKLSYFIYYRRRYNRIPLGDSTPCGIQLMLSLVPLRRILGSVFILARKAHNIRWTGYRSGCCRWNYCILRLFDSQCCYSWIKRRTEIRRDAGDYRADTTGNSTGDIRTDSGAYELPDSGIHRFSDDKHTDFPNRYRYRRIDWRTYSEKEEANVGISDR